LKADFHSEMNWGGGSTPKFPTPGNSNPGQVH